MKLKTVGMREAKAELSRIVRGSQRDRFVITRHGKPMVVVVGVDGMDMVDVIKRFGDAKA